MASFNIQPSLIPCHALRNTNEFLIGTNDIKIKQRLNNSLTAAAFNNLLEKELQNIENYKIELNKIEYQHGCQPNLYNENIR